MGGLLTSGYRRGTRNSFWSLQVGVSVGATCGPWGKPDKALTPQQGQVCNAHVTSSSILMHKMVGSGPRVSSRKSTGSQKVLADTQIEILYK